MSQYSFAKEIIKLIYNDRNYFLVRNYIKRLGGRDKLSTIDEFSKFDNKYPFWNLFISKKDEVILKILLKYFNSQRDVFRDEWVDTNSILRKTTGYIAFMRLLKKIALDMGENLLDYDFSSLMQNINMKHTGKKFDNETYPAGAKGQKKLYDFIFNVYIKN